MALAYKKPRWTANPARTTGKPTSNDLASMTLTWGGKYHFPMSNQQSFGQAIRCFAGPQRRQEYFRLYSDDIILYGYQGVEPGLESVKRFYNAFWEVFPDARVTVQERIEEGETLAQDTLIPERPSS
jgi:hypothetical protein